MNTPTTFSSDKYSLLYFLQNIQNGKIQLPDFQRGWIWDDERIRDLLVSISLSYPIGTMMLIETGNSELQFQPRLVEGVQIAKPPEPDRLILDGQQRLTSLFQAILSGEPVSTKKRGKPVWCWYYLDITKALDPNARKEEVIVSVPHTRVIREFRNGKIIADYSTTERECLYELMPLKVFFDTTGLTEWQMIYMDINPSQRQNRKNRWVEIFKIIQRYQQYQVPFILLHKETPKDAVCHVFEKVNTGGVPLTVFELLTATYAAENFQLRQDWDERKEKLNNQAVLHNVENTDFLQAVTLLATLYRHLRNVNKGVVPEKRGEISCKRQDILGLSLGEYREWAERVTEGFKAAARLLRSENIFTAKDLPYRSQLIPLAASLAYLGSIAENDGVRTKLARWYWCGVFGELYGKSGDFILALDFLDLLKWILNDVDVFSVRAITEAHFVQSRIISLRNRNSPAYRGLCAMLMRDGGLDFRTGEAIDIHKYFDDKIDMHHIFPIEWCKRKGIEANVYNSIINKTPLSARTNRMIGSKKPSSYLYLIQKKAEITKDRMDYILRSHLIEPDLLRADDFDSFFAARKKELLTRIAKAMGKPVLQDNQIGEYGEDW